jgi:hypothetical protein
MLSTVNLQAEMPFNFTLLSSSLLWTKEVLPPFILV